MGFNVTFDYGMRSGFVAGHVTFIGTVILKDLIIDDAGANPNTNFPESGLEPDLPCYGNAS